MPLRDLVFVRCAALLPVLCLPVLCLAVFGCQTAKPSGGATLAGAGGPANTSTSALPGCTVGDLSKFILKPLPSPVTVAELSLPAEANASSLVDLNAQTFMLEVCVGADDSVTFLRLSRGGTALQNPLVLADASASVSAEGLKEAVFGDTQAFKLDIKYTRVVSATFSQNMRIVFAGRTLHGVQAVVAYEAMQLGAGQSQWIGLGKVSAGVLEVGEFAAAGLCAGISTQAEPNHRVMSQGSFKIALTQCNFESGGISGSRDLVVGITVDDSAVPTPSGGITVSKDKVFLSPTQLANASGTLGNAYALDQHKHHGDCDLLFIQAGGAQYAINFGRGPTTAFCPAKDGPGLAGHDPGSTPDGHAMVSWRSAATAAWQAAPLAN